jgi:4-hydroxy-tetrahydrodipicolinate synthase
MGAICCQMQAELIRASLDGESERFLQLSRQVDLLAESTFIAPMEGYIRRLLWALVHLGIIPGEAANDPWGPQLPESEFDEIGRTLDLLRKDIG